LRDVDARKLAQPLTKLAEARLDELLALERGLVLAVLAQIAKLDGFADLIRENNVQFVLELLDFGAEFGLELI
jgi:hypothetical protein